MQLGILASWVFILSTKLFYTTSLPLELMFWFLPVLFVLTQTNSDFTQTDVENSYSAPVSVYRFQQGSAKTLAVFFLLLVLLTAALGGLYFSVKRWLAENNFESKDLNFKNYTK